ncbi:MAG TPA: hypothetical protein VGE93_17470 [Bryobacteraceae bacterium]
MIPIRGSLLLAILSLLATWNSANATVVASPDKQLSFVNDSDNHERDCLVFFADGSRQLDVEELLQNTGEREILESGDLNITCRKWNRSYLLVAVSGSGGEYPDGFNREYLVDPKKQQIRAEGESVWHWSNQCRNPKRIGVAVLLNGDTAYQAIIPVCRIRSAELGAGEKQATLSFTLRTRKRTFFGEPVGSPISWNIWEAESESGSITLGVSALQGKRVLLNTLHTAKPDAVLESKFAQRLVVKTFVAPQSPQVAGKAVAPRKVHTVIHGLQTARNAR